MPTGCERSAIVSGRCFAGCRRRRADPRRGLRAAGSCSCSASPRTRGWCGCSRAVDRAPREADPRSGVASAGHAQLCAGLQADPALQSLVPGAVGRQRRARHRWPGRGDRDRRGRPGRGGARGRRDHPGHRLSRRRPARGRARARARRAAARRRVGGPAAGLSRHFGSRVSQSVSAARPQHRARAQLDDLHDRVPDRPRHVGDRCARRPAAGTIEVRAEACERYNRGLDQSLSGTVWERGCSTFYFDASGRNAVLWPDWTWRFRRRAARLDDDAYALTAPGPPRPPPRRPR